MKAAWPALRRRPDEAVFMLAASALVVALLVFFVRRLAYPFELEWLEGGAVTQIQVLISGEELYREPSLAFTPLIYPPFYYWVSSLVARVVGVGLFAPRLVSVASTVGSMVLVARLVRGEGGRPLAVFASLSFFALCFERSGFFMDLARVDSLFVFLVLLAFFSLRHGAKWRSAAGAGAIFALAFFTKQAGLVVAVAVLAGAIPSDRRRALLASAVFAGVTLVGYLVVNHLTGGWFRYYVFTVPGAHAILWNQWWEMLRTVGWEMLPFTLLLAAMAFGLGIFRDRRAWLYAGLCAGTFVAAYGTMMKLNGFRNSLMPWLVTLSLIAGLGVEAIARAAHEKGPRWLRLTLALVVVQWVVVFSPPSEQLPNELDAVAGKAMIEKLRRRPGPVLALSSSLYPMMAGHAGVSAPAMALVDVLGEMDEARRVRLVDDLRAEIANRHYQTIMTDESTGLLPPEVVKALETGYREAELPIEAPNAMWTKTGLRNRPKAIWIPRQP